MGGRGNAQNGSYVREWRDAGDERDLSVEPGVFGGIVVGLIAAAAFNRFYRLQLPSYLGFFAGKRFVPIVTAFAAIVLGIVLAVRGFSWEARRD